jgi:carboxyl-terminal processing protease
MQRVFRPLAVFVIATAVGVGVGLRAAMLGGATDSSAGDTFPSGYDLAELELTRATLYHVQHSYVDDVRIDWDAMVAAGLEAVEQLVPSVLFTTAGAGPEGTLAIEIGDFHTVVDLPHVDDVDGAERVLEQVAGLLAQHLSPSDLPPAPAMGGAPMARVEYALVNGILSTLDPHSILLPPDAAHEMDLDNQGEFGGLGITIVLDDDHQQLAIECPIPGTPAAEAGLQPGDRVVRIDGESTVNMSLDDAILLLRGPEGGVVQLTVARNGVSEPLTIDVRRAIIDSDPVESALLEGNVGWIRIQSFHEKVATSVVDALTSLHREAGGDLQGLVLDLRGNPGGFLTQAVRVADLFLTHGDIVSTVDGKGRQMEPAELANQPAEPNYPMVVLVDASSASASEILAGALRYNERSVVVGERTFGKGSVQNLQTFFDDSKLKLTISRYLTPGERSIQGVGIPADIELAPVVFVEKGPVRMYHRERVRREADLESSLEASGFVADEPAYRLRYVAPQAERRCDPGPDLRSDRELAFSRLLLVSAGRGGSRPDTLAAGARLVASQSRSYSVELEAAFTARGIDWTDGAPGPRGPVAPVTVTLEAGATGVLRAGTDEVVTLVVTNTTSSPLYRVSGVLEGLPVLDGEEFFLGRLQPGESKRYEVPVRVPDGEPSERALVQVSIRDSGTDELFVSELPVEVHGRRLPALTWTLTPTDSGGDGRLDPGEELRLGVTLRNQGGDAVAPYVHLRNRSGGRVELVEARFEPGPLAAGGEVTGVLTAKVGEARNLAAMAFDLEVGDQQAFDRGVVVRAGKYDWYEQRETLTFVPGEALPPAMARTPPTVEITRDPGRSTTGHRATVSGMVGDDVGIAEVLVFVGDDKVFHEGRRSGSSFRSVPFTAEVLLEPGANTISVLARDDEGLVASRSVVVWSGAAPVLAKAPAE